MFSGIIKSTGKVESVETLGSNKILWVSSDLSPSLSIDQSIAHDGVCLTVTELNSHSHKVEVVQETLKKTTIDQWKAGSVINLEKAISPLTLLDGHLVQGHADTILICIKITDLAGSWRMDFNLPSAFSGFIIPQGSVCINGVSLTVADLDETSFSVAVIPYTFNHTSFKYLREGNPVNVEFDMIGKYIVRQMELRSITE